MTRRRQGSHEIPTRRDRDYDDCGWGLFEKPQAG